jgi:uncharacterized membrane protein SpoIIM required for sporulation/uncharacterized RDD family membrane protein YckC
LTGGAAPQAVRTLAPGLSSALDSYGNRDRHIPEFSRTATTVPLLAPPRGRTSTMPDDDKSRNLMRASEPFRPETILGLDNVAIDLPVAGVGSRILAASLDYLLVGFLLLGWMLASMILGALAGSSGFALVALVVGIFIIDWGYFSLAEILFQGRTLGKKVVRLRVVHRGGSRAGAGTLLLRNVLRPVDLIVGIPLMALDPLARRLGDRLAGTVVIHDRKVEDSPLSRTPPGWTGREIALVEALLGRSGEIEPGRAVSLAERLVSWIERNWPEFLQGIPRDGGPLERLRNAFSGEAGSMDYAQFVARHRGQWDRFEAELARSSRNSFSSSYDQIEEMALEYRRILHAHAAASGRYPGTAAARRLARMALEGTRFFHRETARLSGGFVAVVRRFWLTEFPAAFRRNIRFTGAAAVLFGAAAVFGFVAALEQTALAEAFLGPAIVRDLESGRLWTESAVRLVPPAATSSAIATNNLGVALTAWAGGALAGLGAVYVTLINGFNLGAVLGITLHYSLAGRLLQFVVAHGVLEMTLTLVAAGAGLQLGYALVAVDDRPRREALAASSRDAFRVLLGCLPWFVVLALVEGFVSPTSLASVPVKILLGVGLEATFLLVAWNPFWKEAR